MMSHSGHIPTQRSRCPDPGAPRGRTLKDALGLDKPLRPGERRLSRVSPTPRKTGFAVLNEVNE